MDNQDIINALRELKSAMEPFVTDDDGMLIDGPMRPSGTFVVTVTRDELERASAAWGAAVGIVGRIDRPAQYRPI